jgi:SAM-dependent methyltransferase
MLSTKPRRGENTMKFQVQAQNIKERVALGFNLAPLPIVHTNIYALSARALCEAVALGVFEAIGRDVRSAAEIAAATGLNARALLALLNLLTSTGYLAHRDGRFSATTRTRKWLLDDSGSSIADGIRYFRLQWKMYDHLPRFLRSGQGFRSHDDIDADEWGLYMRAMFQFARMGGKEVARRTPVPRGATTMLDIGGSHGLYSVELCRRVPAMRATVLDLPAAVEASAPLLAAINTEGRVQHRPGNILEEEIGEAQYDLILVANLVHTFSAEQNQLLARKAARALRKGGHFVIMDFLRPEIAGGSDTLSSAQNLFFSLISSAGVHALEEEQDWQRQAGLQPLKVVRLVASPLIQVVAVK